MLNLIWQTKDGDETSFEYEYLTKYLLKNIEYKEYFDYKNYKTVLNNSIIIYSNNKNKIDTDFENYLEQFTNQKFTFYLLHLSNENLNHDYSYYSKAKYVFRSYYDPDIVCSNVCFIPLGFKSGYLNTNTILYNNKKYNFCFIGQPKSDRYELLNIIQQYSTDSFIYLTQSWNCPNSLSVAECKMVYNQSRFVPCPMGWVHADSFRVMESLENNSIPILKSYNGFDYNTKVWGDNPLPKIESWQDLNSFLNLSEQKYQMLFDEIFCWYRIFKYNLGQKINKVICTQ